jgi:hypothetical protein
MRKHFLIVSGHQLVPQIHIVCFCTFISPAQATRPVFLCLFKYKGVNAKR